MNLLRDIFTWWIGATIGTRVWTWRRGLYVGEDEQGNRYYQDRKNGRRWVIYNGPAEASRVPPDWHGWLHYTVDVPPVDETYQRREWEKPHMPNMTGTPQAYRPRGSTLAPPPQPQRTGYQPWRPQ